MSIGYVEQLTGSSQSVKLLDGGDVIVIIVVLTVVPGQKQTPILLCRLRTINRGQLWQKVGWEIGPRLRVASNKVMKHMKHFAKLSSNRQIQLSLNLVGLIFGYVQPPGRLSVRPD